MRTLQYPGWWLAGGLAILALVVGGSLAPSSGMPSYLPKDKILHVGGYFALAFWFGGLLLRRHYFALGIGLLVLGGAIEVMQASMAAGRSGDFVDLAANGLGVVLGLAAATSGLGEWMRVFEQRLAGR
jgi:VanZ family protein